MVDPSMASLKKAWGKNSAWKQKDLTGKMPNFLLQQLMNVTFEKLLIVTKKIEAFAIWCKQRVMYVLDRKDDKCIY